MLQVKSKKNRNALLNGVLHAGKVLIFLILFISQNNLFSQYNAENSDEENRAAHFCSRSYEEYSDNNMALSSHFIKRCENNSISYFSASPDALKMKAIVFLFKNDYGNFISTGKESLLLRKDPLLSYMIAAAAMKIRRSNEAYGYLKEAISSNSSFVQEKEQKIETVHLFNCSLSERTFPVKIPLEPAPLDKNELSQSAFQITVFLKTFVNDTSEIQNYRSVLKNNSEIQDNENLRLLLSDPDNKENHFRCILNFKKEISIKNKYFSRRERLEAESALLHLHKNYIAFHPEPESLFSYGSTLLEMEHYRESLFTFRRVLEKKGWNSVNGEAFPDQKFAEILRKTGYAYSNLNLKQDALSVKRMADVLDTFGHLNSSDAVYRREVLNAARENLNNREALQLLLADAEWRKDGKADYYRKRIIERDKKMDGIEFNTLFGYFFPF